VITFLFLLFLSSLIYSSPELVLNEIAEGEPARALHIADSIIRANPSDPFAAYVHAMALYENGKYDLAVKEAERAADGIPSVNTSDRKELIAVRDYLRESYEILREFKSVDGRYFKFFYHNPKDSILAYEVFKVLDSSRAALGRDLGYLPEDTIRIEVYPDKASFIRVSTLTEDEVKRTGTIALCKFNRMLFISPRAVLRGYKWRETLCHEYTHFVLHRMAGTRLPLWIHEAVAHFQEVRFDGRAGGVLSTTEKGLLQKAIKTNTLISFAKMHPSMAKLKNSTETGTAFAEVLVALKIVHDKGGYKAVRNLINTAASNKNIDSFLVSLTGAKNGFEQYLFDYIKTLPLQEVQNVNPEVPAFVEDGENEKDENSYYRWVRLADKLIKEKRTGAAIKELERAAIVAGGASSWVLTQVAHLYSENGENEKAFSSLNKAIDLYPDDCNAYFKRALLFQKNGKALMAAKDARSALQINPFHHHARELLIELLEETASSSEELKREKKNTAYLYRYK